MADVAKPAFTKLLPKGMAWPSSVKANSQELEAWMSQLVRRYMDDFDDAPGTTTSSKERCIGDVQKPRCVHSSMCHSR